MEKDINRKAMLEHSASGTHFAGLVLPKTQVHQVNRRGRCSHSWRRLTAQRLTARAQIRPSCYKGSVGALEIVEQSFPFKINPFQSLGGDYGDLELKKDYPNQ